MASPRTAAIIVAAGAGVRLGGAAPKQYADLAGRAVLAHAIDALRAHPAIETVHVVIGAGQHDAYATAIGARALPPPVAGGATRRESVANGLAALDPAIEHVLVHDAARPFVPIAVIDRLLAALASAEAAVPVLPIADTLARVDGTRIGETVARDGLLRVQTPQAFRRDALVSAHARWDATREATDDAQMLRAIGGTVAAVAGDALLDKLTYAADLAAARTRLAALLEVRTGTGFDVHAFAPGDHVMLGGVAVPHGAALAGHSDADVALHAIVDAILGALADGDIGSHFPPSDERWRGAASAAFLAHACDRVAQAGGRIDHLDVTIVCEAPKVGPHRAAIRARIAQIAAISPGRVSVKATTTERLGFTGRREGIAAQAIATLRLPPPADEAP